MPAASDKLLLEIPSQRIAIISDIHGEIDALDNLLSALAADTETRNRLIVFIGDLCDRGPDSVAVIKKVMQLVDHGKALLVLGNHEINLITDDAKDGSAWYFDSRLESDSKFYAPFTRASAHEKKIFKEFLSKQAIAITMSDLNLVHAAWDNESIKAIASVDQTDLLDFIQACRDKLQKSGNDGNLRANYLKELSRWQKNLEDPNHPPPHLPTVIEYELLEQQYNPIKRLSSGIEELCKQAFFSGNRWRFLDRTPWWNKESNPKPIIIGHYWRLWHQDKISWSWRYTKLFNAVAPDAWHGLHKQVFCIDYSVGARWRERRLAPIDPSTSTFRLAAMLWPEKELLFDDGSRVKTTN